MAEGDPIELADSQGRQLPPQDARPRMPEPLPVRLVAVNDVRMTARPEALPRLDGLYVDILGFVRHSSQGAPLYRADNFDLHFEVRSDRAREDCRVVQIEVPSLAAVERKLIDAGIEYTRIRGLVPSTESLVLSDPAGNWIELVESRPL